MVEGARLEIVCTSKAYRGFESLSIRHLQQNPPFAEGFVVNDVGEEDLNPRKRGFDYKRKADGSMPVGFADERSE